MVTGRRVLLPTAWGRVTAISGLWLGLLCLIGWPGCASEDRTMMRLTVQYDEAWVFDRLDIELATTTTTVEPSHEVVVVVPDDWADHPMEVHVSATRDGERIARGTIEMVLVRGEERSGTVELEPLVCGAWCTAGTTSCQANAVITCEAGTNPCRNWSAPVACAGGTTCSLGECSAQCVDECADGEARCDGPGATSLCGQADLDPCLDWLPSTPCTTGTCVGGACADVCQDVCSLGDAVCSGAGTMACADLNGDGCMEWGPMVPCPPGQFCSNGMCAGTCADECTATGCEGLAYAQCGQYDHDPCRDRSPGVTCVIPGDACVIGECTAAGCTTHPRVCEQPPAPSCVDDTTLRTHDAIGACALGECSYEFRDEACPGGCEAGACRPFCEPSGCDGRGCCGDRCCDVVPSNAATYGALEPTGLILTPSGLGFDTTSSCAVGSALGNCAVVGNMCVCRSDRLHLPANFTVWGTRGLVLLVYDTIRIWKLDVTAGAGTTSGGRLQITAGRAINVMYGINAPGAGGSGGCDDASGRSGSRGGSIVLDTANLWVAGVLAANGGGGGGGGDGRSPSGCGGDGRPGLLSATMRAPGGGGARYGCNTVVFEGGEGGEGSIGNGSGGSGRSGDSFNCNGSSISMESGGNGGGAGSITINTLSGSCAMCGGISPPPTFGTVEVQ